MSIVIETQKPSISEARVPSPGEIVRVRQRFYLVEDVIRA